MNIEELRRLMDAALTSEDPELRAFCEPYYSPYYQLEFLLALSGNGKVCVELGVDQGRGSMAFLLGGAGMVIAIDNDPNKNCERIDRERWGERFNLLHCSSTPNPIEKPSKIDVLMIDTEHSWDQAAAEFQAYKPFLKDGAVVLFDDTHAKDDDVFNYFVSLPYEKIVDDRLHPTCGFGALIYRENA